uniref:Basic proline-rich protein n=1 Tax=Nonomuraea gerenzanensis TaxID=93944 RepID=A0A1M4E5A6_9ACTN|nr:hypothetical protein [Nonomuraea gerenzanensis]SBO94016.1 Basic proline-rich protein [Nonomuraea gerenzanensis]
MGRYASVDWIQFEWDEQRTGLGPVRTSLEQTASWYHQLGPWLDPGPEPGVSLCRLLVDGRVVVLARTRTGGADSRRTIRVQAYLGGSTSLPMAMPNVRQTLALAAGWGARLPAEDVPLDLGKLISSYEGARAALDRESRAVAAALAPIVSEYLRRPGAPLSVASGGNAIVQLWGLVDVLDVALGQHPETFSTYESDDFNLGAEIVFLRKWPGVSSQSSNRTRVDPRSPGQEDRCSEIAAMLVDAYARDQLVGLVKRLRISDQTPMEERLRRLGSVARGRPGAGGSGESGDELVWSPQPPARSHPAAAPGESPYGGAPVSQEATPGHATQPSQAGSAQAGYAQAGFAQAGAQAGTEAASAQAASAQAAAQAGQTTELQRPQAAGRAVQAQGAPQARAASQGPGRMPGGRAPQGEAGWSAGPLTQEGRGQEGPPSPAPGPRAAAAPEQHPGTTPGDPGPGPEAHSPGLGPGPEAHSPGAPAGALVERQYAEQDAFEMLCTDLDQATTPRDLSAILQEMRALAARRQPAEVRSHLPRLIPVLERQLPDGQVNPFLRALLDPDATTQPRRSKWLDPQWLVIVALLTVLVILVFVTLFLLV